MKIQRIVLRFIVLLMFMLAGSMLLPKNQAQAAPTAVRVEAVEYYEEEIVVQNNENTKIYYATELEAARNNWEIINADSGQTTSFDISWLSSSVENILIIKGDKDSTKSRVILNKKPAKLEISINYANIDSLSDNATIAELVNIMTTEGNGSAPIKFADLEWRKGDNGQWSDTSSLKAGLFKKYLVKGTYLYFRIKALDDTYIGTGTTYPDGTKGRRFSNAVKVKVVKQAPSMVYGIDGSKFTAEIKYGKEYRVTVEGTTTTWVKVTDRAVRTIPLTTIINNPSFDGTTKAKAFKAMTIEVRDYSTSKAASSKITEINLDAQRTINNNIIPGKAPVDAITNGDTNIYVSYNGNKNMIISIPTATPDLPYEFCVVKNGVTFDLTKVVWTSITKGTEVKVLASKAVDGGTLYVRQKEIKSQEATATKAAVGYKLASTYVTHTINYPSVPEIADASYTFTKGYSGDIKFTAVLNVAGKNPFETTIKNIKLGTKEITFSTSTATTTTTSGDVFTMTITLNKDSLTTMTNCTSKAITITFMNGTVDKTSIKLTIQNPTTAGMLTITTTTGTNTGTTSFTVVTTKAAGNSWAYVIGTSEIKNVTNQDKILNLTTATPATFTTATVDNISITASTSTTSQYLTIFEIDAAGYIVKYKCITVTSDIIK